LPEQNNPIIVLKLRPALWLCKQRRAMVWGNYTWNWLNEHDECTLVRVILAPHPSSTKKRMSWFHYVLS
jgi:hypothetical protein